MKLLPVNLSKCTLAPPGALRGGSGGPPGAASLDLSLPRPPSPPASPPSSTLSLLSSLHPQSSSPSPLHLLHPEASSPADQMAALLGPEQVGPNTRQDWPGLGCIHPQRSRSWLV